MVKSGIGITPDRYFFVLLLGSLFLHKTFKFLHDFLPFILIILSYDFLRGFADDINRNVHYLEKVNATKFLFNGNIPTLFMQNLFYHPHFLQWYDYAASYLYLLHFAVPLAFAFLLWVYSRKAFLEFSIGLSLVSYAALLLYVLFPTAPPWLASTHGYIPHVTKIFNVVFAHTSDQAPTIYKFIGQNLVAAVPSMHAAYSFLIFLYALRYFKKWGFLVLIYCILMWLAIVYLGEHYLIDILTGAIFDLFFFVISIWVVQNYKHWYKTS